MKVPKIDLSTGCLVFLCGYGVFDPYGSFWPFLLSVLLHELAHMVMLRCLGKKILSIKGSLEGFLIQTEPLSYVEELITASVGPLVNLLLLLLAGKQYPVMALVNGALLVYNLLPFYPMDGGRILRSCLSMMLPLTLGEMVERGVGLCVFTLLFMVALYLSFGLHSGLWPVLFCAFLFLRVGKVICPE